LALIDILFSDTVFIVFFIALIVAILLLVWFINEYKRIHEEEEDQELQDLTEESPPPPAPTLSQEELDLAQSLYPSVQPAVETKQAPGALEPLPSAETNGKTTQAQSSDSSDIMFGVIEEKFGELTQRIGTLESQKAVAQPATDTRQIMAVMEKISNLEKLVEQMRGNTGGSGGNSAEVTQLSERVRGLQTMMEDLAKEDE